MTVDEQRIRDLAYQIWESEGRPEGQEHRHWIMACKLADAGETPTAGIALKRRRKVEFPDEPTDPLPAKKTSAEKAPVTKTALLKTPKKTPRVDRIGKTLE